MGKEMVKLQTKDLVNSANALGELSNLDLKMKLSFRVAKVIKEVDGVIEVFNEKRDVIVKEVEALKEERGLSKEDRLPEEDEKPFNDRVIALLDEEIEVEIEKLSISDLEAYSFPAKHLINLDWLLVD